MFQGVVLWAFIGPCIWKVTGS